MLLADSGDITALGCTFIIFGLPAVLWFVTRYMKYRERMALIQSGMNPYGPAGTYGGPNPGAYVPPQGAYVPPQGAPSGPPPGAGAYAPPPPYVYDPRYSRKANRRMARASRDCMNETPEGQVRNGIRTSFIGMALTIGLSFIGFNHDGFEAGPWLLGGLIPLFVGLSQIMNGVMSGAPNPFANRGFYMGPQQQPWTPPGPGANAGYGAGGNGATGNGAPGPASAGAPPSYDSYSYTYRPGVTPEIQPPPRPPDRR